MESGELLLWDVQGIGNDGAGKSGAGHSRAMGRGTQSGDGTRDAVGRWDEGRSRAKGRGSRHNEGGKKFLARKCIQFLYKLRKVW